MEFEGLNFAMRKKSPWGIVLLDASAASYRLADTHFEAEMPLELRARNVKHSTANAQLQIGGWRGCSVACVRRWSPHRTSGGARVPRAHFKALKERKNHRESAGLPKAPAHRRPLSSLRDLDQGSRDFRPTGRFALGPRRLVSPLLGQGVRLPRIRRRPCSFSHTLTPPSSCETHPLKPNPIRP